MADEPLWRAGIFLGVFAVLALVELAFPHHESPAKGRRWAGNLALFVTGIIVARLLLPGGAVLFASVVEAKGWGLFAFLPAPFWLEVVLAVILFDFVIWGQHVMFHKIGWLWRLHRVHHADPEMDVTTGLRFHPVEILISLLVKLGLIAAFGPAAFAVFLFEVLLNAGAMATHANWRLPPKFDHAVRWLFVTPGMHRVHHAKDRRDTDSNYGFNLAIWDRLFGTYRPEPVPGDEAVRFGIGAFATPADQRVDQLLIQPLRQAPDQPSSGA
jgi:sterol desaturase/sphingolipid hydroxylase (fatty acid hydroxylase superfamily)